MHICIPDSREVRPPRGSAFLLYNVHIDGLYHCSLRFKQLLHLHQALSKKFANSHYQLPPFPPKKLFPLTETQIEERRAQLEKYLQNISQDKNISNSSIFNLFFLEAQRESTNTRDCQAYLDIELVNGQKIRLQIVTHDSTDAVLTAVCHALGLDDKYHAYFCLCLCGYDVVGDKLIIKRRLSFFESPYVTLQTAVRQQEQLQTALSAATSNYSTTSSCHCQCCAAGQQFTNTDVPPIGSSGGTSVHINDVTENSRNNLQLMHGSQINNGSNTTTNNNFHYHQHQYHHKNRSDCCCNQNSSMRRVPVPQTQQSRSFVTHRILLRKSYWDPIYDTHLLNDSQALDILFIQTVYDIKHSLMFANRETYHQLESLSASNSKLEYILLARTLKYYNYVHFEPCISNYPRPNTRVLISIGSKELNMRVLKSPGKSISQLSATARSSGGSQQSSSTLMPTAAQSKPTTSSSNNGDANEQVSHISESNVRCTPSTVPNNIHHVELKDDLVEEEYNFKVPLIRCWRLTSLETLNNNSTETSTVAQTSLVNTGKKRSLSLFNSVIKPSSSRIEDENGNDCDFQKNHSNGECGRQHRNSVCSGTGGNSLLVALSRNYSANNIENNHHQGNGCPCVQNNRGESFVDYGRQYQSPQFSQYELSFEYLISKYSLKWITISSDQAIFISISLQGVVDELISRRDNPLPLYGDLSLQNLTDSTDSSSNNATIDDTNNAHLIPANSIAQSSFVYMCRNGILRPVNTNQQLIDKFGLLPMRQGISASGHHQQSPPRQVRSTHSTSLPSSSRAFFASPISCRLQDQTVNRQYAFEISNQKKAPSPIINGAFEGVTNDDDL